MNKNNSLKNIQDLINNKNLDNSILNTTFKNIKQLKQGGFGTVYSGIHLLDSNNYAIKKIPIQNNNNNIISNKFKLKLKEVRCLSLLNHKNIIRYNTSWIEYCNDEINIFIQMELMNLSLGDYLIKYKNFDKNFVIKNIIEGVKYLHDNDIIHCDLKPDNILLNLNENKIEQIKIADFGLVFEKNKNNYIDSEYGTSIYMPNETIYTTKYDIYSLGIIFFEILHHFNTHHERIIEIRKLKSNEYINKYQLIYIMINNDYTKRCDIYYLNNLDNIL
tara:strand:+ start:394 stop:1218 length:825 start_codon:yes stop_codon:yes gene_type:complete